MILKLYKEQTSHRDLNKVCSVLHSDGVVIYPTDSVYALGCAINSPKGVDKLRKLTGKDIKEFSIIFNDISTMAEYCRIDNATFKILKRNMPCAITFILRASSRIPDRIIGKRKTIGARIPDNSIVRAMVDALGVPMLTTSLKSDYDYDEYLTDPELINEKWGDKVDLVIDGGIGYITPTTVVDLSDGEVEIIREGEAELL
ncbi:MAG: L-threonylcarbamoyladenylate synthase [Rikenellaceae bacterium]